MSSQSLQRSEAWQRYLLIKQKAYKNCMDEFLDLFGDQLLLAELSEPNVRGEVVN